MQYGGNNDLDMEYHELVSILLNSIQDPKTATFTLVHPVINEDLNLTQQTFRQF